MSNPVYSQIDAAEIGSLKPDEVLYDFDGPRLFTATNDFGELVLAYQCEEIDDGRRFVVVPITESRVAALKAGSASVREVLEHRRVMIADIAWSGEVKVLGSMLSRLLRSDMLPRKGTLLWPRLTPVLAVRLIGEGLVEGAIPASVIKRAALKLAMAIEPAIKMSGSQRQRIVELPKA